VLINTFAAFFWWLVDSYGRFALDGTHLRSWLVGPQKTGVDFVPQGHVGYTFDELKKCASEILGVSAVRELISDIYPLVIVDEHQDIDLTLHKILVLLAEGSNLVLLRGPGQCIYRGLHDFSPDEVLRRTAADLQPQHFMISALDSSRRRHCDEIYKFLSQYNNNSTCTFDNNRIQRRLKPLKTNKGYPNPLETHIAIAVNDLWEKLKSIFPQQKSFSIGVLASTNLAVARIYKMITERSSAYKLRASQASPLFDDSLLFNYGRLILQLLDGHWIALKRSPIDDKLVAGCLVLLARTTEGAPYKDDKHRSSRIVSHHDGSGFRLFKSLALNNQRQNQKVCKEKGSRAQLGLPGRSRWRKPTAGSRPVDYSAEVGAKRFDCWDQWGGGNEDVEENSSREVAKRNEVTSKMTTAGSLTNGNYEYIFIKHERRR